MKSNPLRFDGIYYLKHESGVNFVLRFYENGIVCGGYITSDPKNVCDSFNPDVANHGFGPYTIINGGITFSFISEEGSIDYHCSFSGKKLKCDILSTITKKIMKWVYKFVKF